MMTDRLSASIESQEKLREETNESKPSATGGITKSKGSAIYMAANEEDLPQEESHSRMDAKSNKLPPEDSLMLPMVSSQNEQEFIPNASIPDMVAHK